MGNPKGKHKVAIQIYLLLSLCACAGIVRQTNFECSPQQEIDHGIRIVEDNHLNIELTTPCAGQFYLFIGPFIGLPLPIFPNPIDWYLFLLRQPKIHIQISQIPTHIDLKRAVVVLYINGRVVPSSVEKIDIENPTNHSINIGCIPGLSCSQLESAEIRIDIDGISNSKKSEVRYFKSHWGTDVAP